MLIESRFLLPALQVQTVLEEPTLSKRRKALSIIPKKLDDAFKITINRINDQPKARANQAMEVLKWTLLAKAQLSVSELRHALAVTLGDTELDRDNLPPENSLIEWYLGLVILDKETSQIHLVHKSLFEYLKKQHETGRLFKGARNQIALSCIKYMNFVDESVNWDNLIGWECKPFPTP